MNAQMLTTISGIALSLFFSYVPGLNTKFATLDPIYKRLIMLICLLIVSAASFGLACWPLFAEYVNVTCDVPGFVGLLQSFILAAIANQTAYSLSPQPKVVREAKAKSGG